MYLESLYWSTIWDFLDAQEPVSTARLWSLVFVTHKGPGSTEYAMQHYAATVAAAATAQSQQRAWGSSVIDS